MSDTAPRSPLGPLSPAFPLRFGDERFQDSPQNHEFPAFTVDIVSCELPSGAAWLFSCLLELGVSAWNPWNADTRSEWMPRGHRRYRYWCAGEPWRRLAPGLASGREFGFAAEPVPRYTHAWPGRHPECARTILVVRDPRDALYSAWRRDEAAQAVPSTDTDRFVRFANAVAEGSAVRRAKYWDRFHAAWADYTNERSVLVVRFEDFKADLQRALRRVCDYLDLAPDASAMQSAITISDGANVLRVDHEMVARGVFQWPINRAGIPNEFMTVYTPKMKAVFSGASESTWQRFGYSNRPI